MDRVNTLGAGIALAVTLALISAVCAIAFVLVPEATPISSVHSCTAST